MVAASDSKPARVLRRFAWPIWRQFFSFVSCGGRSGGIGLGQRPIQHLREPGMLRGIEKATSPSFSAALYQLVSVCRWWISCSERIEYHGTVWDSLGTSCLQPIRKTAPGDHCHTFSLSHTLATVAFLAQVSHSRKCIANVTNRSALLKWCVQSLRFQIEGRWDLMSSRLASLHRCLA